MYCKKCGNELKEGERYCPNCGEKIEQNNNHSSKAKKEINSFIKENIPAIIIISSIIIVLIIYLIIYNSTYENNSNNNNNNNKNSNISTDTNSNTTSTISSNNNSYSKELTIDDVEINKVFRTSEDINEASNVVLSFAWSKIKETCPNASWNSSEIIKADGYGRFITKINYVKSSVSESASTTYSYVTITDMPSKKGICLIWGPDYYNYTSSYGWGTPLSDTN